MDYLWTPWRYNYVTQADKDKRQGVPPELCGWPGDLGCVFCNIVGATDHAIASGMDREEADRAAGIVFRGKLNYICVNRFPYTSGHLMVVPYQHQSALGALPRETAREMMDLAQRSERLLSAIYRPDGFNIGFNLGRAAGAGVAAHLHLHALPRWFGDTNFLTTIGEARLLPEDLPTTWERLRTAFASAASNSGDQGPSTP